MRMSLILSVVLIHDTRKVAGEGALFLTIYDTGHALFERGKA